MSEILSIGELLIDFTPSDNTEDGRLLFARNPGGAPANVAVQAVRAGVSAGFLGRVGDDMFGHFLADTLKTCGVNADGVSFDPNHATTLAFVQLDDNGDRDFRFYRNPGADTQLTSAHVDKSLIDNCKLICYGSLITTAEPSRSAVFELLRYAKKVGKMTAYDPNWRQPLWTNQETGVRSMKELLPYADILKISEEELELLTDLTDIAKGARELLKVGVKLILVTRGAAGCQVFTDRLELNLPTYDTKVKDTTGSGDSFYGAFLSKIAGCDHSIEEITESELSDFVDFANAAGAVCATKNGAIPALPTKEEIEECRKSVPKLSVTKDKS